jgi:hypothetical protein
MLTRFINDKNLKIWFVPMLCLFGALLSRSVQILQLPDQEVISLIGDDVYYALGLAFNFAEFNIFSFSLEPKAISNGFQFVTFILSYFCFKLGFDDIEAIKLIMVVNLFAIFALSLYAIYALRRVKTYAQIIIILYFSSSLIQNKYLYNGIETSLFYMIIVFNILVIYNIYFNSEVRSLNYKSFNIISLLPLTIFLIRTEGLPLVFMLLLFYLYKLEMKRRLILMTVYTIFFISYFSLSKYIFGNFTQSSSLHYSILRINNLDTQPIPIVVMKQYIGYLDQRLNFFIVILFLSVFIAMISALTSKKSPVLKIQENVTLFYFSLFLAISIQLLISISYYSYIQRIYFERYAVLMDVSLVLLLISSSLYIVNFFSNTFYLKKIVELMVLILAIYVCVSTVFNANKSSFSARDNLDERHAFVASGKLIAEKQETVETYGGWNSGIIGFYSQGSVLNLDGRINSEIFDPSIAPEFESYNLKYPQMLEVNNPIDTILELLSYMQMKSLTHIVDAKDVPLNHLVHMYKTSPKCIEEIFVPEKRLSDITWYGGIWTFRINYDKSNFCSTD